MVVVWNIFRIILKLCKQINWRTRALADRSWIFNRSIGPTRGSQAQPEEAPIGRAKLADRSPTAPVVRHFWPNVRARASESGQRQCRSIAVYSRPIARLVDQSPRCCGSIARTQGHSAPALFYAFSLLFLVISELFRDISEFLIY